jgi:hypothetical protein
VLDSDATGDGGRVGNPEMSSEYSVSSSDDPRNQGFLLDLQDFGSPFYGS